MIVLLIAIFLPPSSYLWLHKDKHTSSRAYDEEEAPSLIQNGWTFEAWPNNNCAGNAGWQTGGVAAAGCTACPANTVPQYIGRCGWSVENLYV